MKVSKWQGFRSLTRKKGEQKYEGQMIKIPVGKYMGTDRNFVHQAL
jgi:hypothetical protein